VWPVNTHGGLLGYGAPWEVPAMISLVEAVAQLRGEAVRRQVQRAQRALVYGNGGIFSASAVAILEGCSTPGQQQGQPLGTPPASRM
jgi:acetyl-CoA acetyltransferase